MRPIEENSDVSLASRFERVDTKEEIKAPIFETERRVGERSRLARLARSRVGRLGMALFLFVSTSAEVACSREDSNKGRGGERVMEQDQNQRALQELLTELKGIPNNPSAESLAQKRAFAGGAIRAFLRIRGDTPEMRKMLNDAIGSSKELAWVSHGKAVFEVSQSSPRGEKESLGTTEQRATNLLRSFQGLIATPSAYRRDIENYLNDFSDDEKQAAIDALKVAMQDADLIAKLPGDARKALQSVMHEHVNQ